MKLTLATSDFCGPCKMIKQYAKDNNISLEIKDMMDDSAFFKDNDIKSVPTLLVEAPSGIQRYIGFGDIQNRLKEEI